MHYYKRNLGDYAKKAGRLSMLQHGSYTLLIDACYDREQFPTLEEAIEWTWASTTEEVEAVTFVLRKFFTLENGVYVQKRIQEEIAEYHNKAETNKRIAIERETVRAAKRTERAQGVNDSHKSGDEPPPNHKPITNNQEPNKEYTPTSSGPSADAADDSKPLIAKDLIAEGIEPQVAADWLKVRKAKKAPLTRTAWDAVKREGESAGLTPAQTVKTATENGWQGFKASWLQSKTGAAGQRTTSNDWTSGAT